MIRKCVDEVQARIDRLEKMEPAFEAMREALRAFGKIGLWEDNYTPDSDEYAEVSKEDNRLDVWVLPSRIRAARAALALADKVSR